MPESRLLSIAGAHEVYHRVLTVDNVTLQQKLKDTVRKNTQIMSLIYITDLSVTSPSNKVCQNFKMHDRYGNLSISYLEYEGSFDT